MPKRVMLTIVQRMPSNLDELLQLCCSCDSPLIPKYSQEILNVLHEPASSTVIIDNISFHNAFPSFINLLGIQNKRTL